MRKILCMLILAAPSGLLAQQVLNNAILKAKIETSSENASGGDGVNIQLAGSEVDITVWVKDSLRKVATQSNAANTITLYNGNTGLTTNLIESMGERTGFTQTAAQKAEQQRRMDSIQKAREQQPAEGGMVVRMVGPAKTTNVELTAETKVINKFNCKKAILTTENSQGEQKKLEVWYTDEYRLPVGISFRSGIDVSKVPGIAVQYESANTISFGNNEITMVTHYELKSIETNKTIGDKEFELPKGYEIKTWDQYIKDNPEGGSGIRRTIRIGG